MRPSRIADDVRAQAEASAYSNKKGLPTIRDLKAQDRADCAHDGRLKGGDNSPYNATYGITVNLPEVPTSTGNWINRLQGHIANLAGLLERAPWLVPAVSFAFGWVGFLLVRRGEEMARVIAILAFIGWPWLLVEPYLRKYLQSKTPGKLSDIVFNFIGQSVQQELFFFSLPLIIGATQLHIGQLLFAAIAIGAALISTIDPIYNHRIAGRPVISLAFHGYCSWLAALVVLPLVIHVPLERAFPYAMLFVAVWLLLTLPRSLKVLPSTRQRVAWVVGCVLIPLTIWQLRDNIPAAGLSVRQAQITQTINNLVPGEPLKVIHRADLTQGVIAFVAIRAPMGVAQSVIFEWHHGELRERIPAEIIGANKSGWRTWSRKLNFPQDATGKWTVDVLTPQGQLIKRLSFIVD